MIAANVDSGKAGEENFRVQSNTGTNGYDKDMAMKRKLSGELEPEDKAKKIRSEEPYSEDKELKKRKRSEDDNASEEKKKKKKKKHKHKDEKERDRDREKSKNDNSTENWSGNEDGVKQKLAKTESVSKINEDGVKQK